MQSTGVCIAIRAGRFMYFEAVADLRCTGNETSVILIQKVYREMVTPSEDNKAFYSDVTK